MTEKENEYISTAQDHRCNHPQVVHASDIFNYWPRERLQELTDKYEFQKKYTEEVLNKMGFDIIDGEIVLIPIELKRFCEYFNIGIPKVLLHVGFKSNKDIDTEEDIKDKIPPFDNSNNMEELGVWGNPDMNAMTFLKPHSSGVFAMERTGKACLLTVDPNKLLIYTDPEMHIPPEDKNFEGKEFDVPGASFAVFGGIPVDAILKREKGYLDVNNFKLDLEV